MPFDSACRALVDTRSLNRAMRFFISSCVGVFVLAGMSIPLEEFIAPLILPGRSPPVVNTQRTSKGRETQHVVWIIARMAVAPTQAQDQRCGFDVFQHPR